MGWCQVALIATFVVLLQCGLQHAASCKNRKTVIQLRLSGKTNINVKFPPKSDPVKFDPFPYRNNAGKNNADCFICNGPRCQKCTRTENQSPSSTISQESTPQRTNIVIDLRRLGSDSQNEPQNNIRKNKTSPPTGAGGISPQDGTVVVLQDLTSASSASNSASSDSGSNGAQTAASSASSAAISDSDIIASFDPTSPEGGSASDTEDIFIQDHSTSIAGSSAVSNADNQPKSVPNNKTPAAESTPSSVSASKAIGKTDNSENSNLANSETAAKSNAENTSSNGDKATTSAVGQSAADAKRNEDDNEATAAAEVVVKSTSSIADGAGSDTVTALSQAAAFDDLE